MTSDKVLFADVRKRSKCQRNQSTLVARPSAAVRQRSLEPVFCAREQKREHQVGGDMAVRRNLLSARGVATATKPGRHADGGNLYLNVTATGAKSWVFMYRFGGRQREKGLGSAADVTLASAREKALAFRLDLKEGRDPLAVKLKQRVVTFGEAADDYVEAMRPQWKSIKHANQWSSTLTHPARSLRGRPVQEVDTEAILAVLQPIWLVTPETASRLRGRIESVLDAAKAKGLRSGENPARWRGHLDQLLPKRPKFSRGHYAAMAYAEVPAFVVRLRKLHSVSASAMEFTILTAARSGEALKARWDEVNLAAGVWTVPANRMKGGREHRVPLVGRALEIVSQLAETAQGDFVFPGGREGKPLSNMAFEMLLQRTKAGVTTHGFRSSFRDWAAEQTSTPHEVAEMALAHTISNAVERAYRRGDMFEKRRELMSAWAAYCEGSG